MGGSGGEGAEGREREGRERRCRRQGRGEETERGTWDKGGVRGGEGASANDERLGAERSQWGK